MQKLAIAAAILLLPVSLNAQWLDWRTPDIPRTADGKPNLTAPAPRTSTGKPDFSGIWQPELNPYRFSVILDLKDEVIFRPAAEAIFQGRVKDYRREDPVTNCLPAGPSEPINVMYRIIQTPHPSRCWLRAERDGTGKSKWTGGNCPKIRIRVRSGSPSAAGPASRRAWEP